MVPGLVGRIAELLESIDSKLDKVNVAPIPTDDTPELMNVKDLGRYLPSHPAPSTVYGWVNENTIPYYKQGKTLMFKKSEIDKCVSSNFASADFRKIKTYNFQKS